MQLESDVISRVHAEISFVDGQWRIQDLQSTNGIFVDGEKVLTATLKDESTIMVGHGGPTLRVRIESPAVAGTKGPKRDSVVRALEYYFNASPGQRGGRRTAAIRDAFAVVQKTQRRRFGWFVLAASTMTIIGAVLAFSLRAKNLRLVEAAGEMLSDIKELDVQTFELRRAIEQREGTDLDDVLASIDDQRRRLRSRYDGYIRELGVYRELGTEEERLIHRTARIFNESEFAMTAEFAREVGEKIQYWQTTGRETFVEAIERAEANGYTPFIVRIFIDHGLPPEFFYLGLQESAFQPDRVGPQTRWGRAKGMWQFIPTTAIEYGLDPGARRRSALPDPSDERQDFRLSTVAAARYLRDIHGTLTQASGLLVMAAYNWGEHQISPRLDSIATPTEAFAVTFHDVPRDPASRNYWNFLGTYGNRIPYETRDYVLKIFAAATIGQNPHLFGFDFDDPLARHLDFE